MFEKLAPLPGIQHNCEDAACEDNSILPPAVKLDDTLTKLLKEVPR